jgi:hypothetical protein
MNYLKPTWTSQPQSAAEIDWSNPVTNDLISAVHGPSGKLITRNGVISRLSQNTAPAKGCRSSGVSLEFDGANNSFAHAFTPTSKQEMTFVVWFYQNTSAVADKRIVSISLSSAGSGNHWSLGTGTTDGTKLKTYSSNSAESPTGSIQNNVLKRAAAVFTLAAMDVYDNGAKVATGTPAIGMTTYDRICYGSLVRASNAAVLNGGIVFAAAWNRALSPSEVKSLSDNPWQIFKPIQRRIFVGIPAASGDGSASLITTTDDSVFYGSATSASGASCNITTSTVDSVFSGGAYVSPRAALSTSTIDSVFSGGASVSPRASVATSTADSVFSGGAASGNGASVSTTTENSTVSSSAYVRPVASITTSTDAAFSGGASVSPIAGVSTTTASSVFSGSAAVNASASISTTTQDSVFASGASVSPIALLSATTTATFSGGATGLALFTQAELDYLLAYMQEHLMIPSAADIAAAVLAAAQITPIQSNIKQVNSVQITGTGHTGDTWGPAS